MIGDNLTRIEVIRPSSETAWSRASSAGVDCRRTSILWRRIFRAMRNAALAPTDAPMNTTRLPMNGPNRAPAPSERILPGRKRTVPIAKTSAYTMGALGPSSPIERSLSFSEELQSITMNVTPKPMSRISPAPMSRVRLVDLGALLTPLPR